MSPFVITSSSPVPASAAKAIAKAIAEDGSVTANAESQGQLSEQDQTNPLNRSRDGCQGVDYAESPAKGLPRLKTANRTHGLIRSASRVFRSISTTNKGATSLRPPLLRRRARFFTSSSRVVHRDPSSTSSSPTPPLSVHVHWHARLSATQRLLNEDRPPLTFLRLQPYPQMFFPTPPPVSPSKKRFALYPKKSNQSFPISAAPRFSQAANLDPQNYRLACGRRPGEIR